MVKPRWWPFQDMGETLNFLLLLATVVGLYLVREQLIQANVQQRWNNYNQMNLQYASLYAAMPEELEASACKTFDGLKAESKRWIRSYFNLYTEEHWLYQNGLIPAQMWTDRIDGGVTVNMESYPVIVDGYEHWKKLGSFTYPAEFIPLVDGKIKGLAEQLKVARASCTRPPVTAAPTPAPALQPPPAQR
jgi:hypothetical protein